MEFIVGFSRLASFRYQVYWLYVDPVQHSLFLGTYINTYFRTDEHVVIPFYINATLGY